MTDGGEAPARPPMTPEAWSRLEPLVDAALELPPERRQAYIEAIAASDSTLAAALEHLIGLATRGDSLFEAAAAERSALLASTRSTADGQLIVQLQASLGTNYEVEREIGGGGMSRVFVARELSLGRSVVIKVLPSDLAAGVSADRFAREIKLAASLQQANIVPLLAAGTASGFPYYTMPLVEGRSLRERLARDGPLPINEAIGILRDIARALAYAHARGVVHRDIKPGNVLLSGKTAVVTDFGIAKALGDARGEHGHVTLTGTGTSVGTPAYMAPEQAAGDPATDHRADIYAFGCVAYEVFTGKPPFPRAAPHEVIAAHFRERPKPVTEQRADVPPTIADLIAKCLEKDPARRPQTAEDVLQSLDVATTDPVTVPRRRSRRAVVGGVAAVGILVAGAASFALRSHDQPPEPLTFAVVPFRNLAHDTALDYRSDGIADEILNGMATVPGVQIVGRDAARRYRGRPGNEAPDPRTIENGLGARLLVTGTLRELDGRITISTQLNDSTSRGELWAGSFVRDAKDFGSIADDIVRTLADTLAARFGDRIRAPQRAVSATGTSNPAALDLYLIGQQQMKRRGAGVRQSVLNFERAIDLDPKFARAYAGLATALQLTPFFDGTPPPDVRERTLNAARRALELDNTLADAHVALGCVYAFAAQWDSSDAEFRRALALDPNNAAALQTFARLLIVRGDVEPALGYLDRARKIERVSPIISAWLAYGFFLTGHVDSALAESARSIQLDSTVLPATNIAGQLNVAAGRRDAAHRVADVAAVIGGMTSAPYVLAKLGDTATANRIVRSMEANSPPPWYAVMERVGISIALGDTAAALSGLERTAQSVGAAWIQPFAVRDPVYDPIRRSPRFVALLRQTNLDVASLTALRSERGR